MAWIQRNLHWKISSEIYQQNTFAYVGQPYQILLISLFTGSDIPWHFCWFINHQEQFLCEKLVWFGGFWTAIYCLFILAVSVTVVKVTENILNLLKTSFFILFCFKWWKFEAANCLLLIVFLFRNVAFQNYIHGRDKGKQRKNFVFMMDHRMPMETHMLVMLWIKYVLLNY